MNTKNTTPAVPLGLPGGAHTVVEVMELAEDYALASAEEMAGSYVCTSDKDMQELEDRQETAKAALLAAIEKLVSDRDVLLSALEYMVNVCPAIDSSGEEAHEKARAAIQKVTK